MTALALPVRPTPPTSNDDWLQPIGAHAPCGPSLEYDHDYAVLFSRMVPQADAQYGSFVGTPDVPNWAEIERDCLRLLLRTKDINLLVWLCRARTRLGQAQGLAHVLGMLSDVLHAWPDAVHPQLTIDGEFEPSVRANAIAGLADVEGLLGDVCDIAVASNTAMRLTVRDVERAFAVPRSAEAASPESVKQQLAALRAASRGDPQTPMAWLEQAGGHVEAIDTWAKVQLGDEAPSLHALRRVLDMFKDPSAKGTGEASMPEARVALPLSSAETFTMTPSHRHALTREAVRSNIQSAREWFEQHEPSSPIAVLLKQAERMVGKRFSQVADSIPLDLLHKWDAPAEGEEAQP